MEESIYVTFSGGMTVGVSELRKSKEAGGDGLRVGVVR